MRVWWNWRDTLHLGCSALVHEGSTPFTRTELFFVSGPELTPLMVQLAT